MTTEQKKLLYEIAKWHNKDFYNRMEDHWTTANYVVDGECTRNINALEKEYKETYGGLPEWKYIDDVWAVIKTLEKELAV